jgi:hypothetical protein
MKTLQFKTNINCGGCIKAVTPTLNEQAGAGNWHKLCRPLSRPASRLLLPKRRLLLKKSPA